MKILLFLSLFLGWRSHAVDVAFLEIHDSTGRPIQLEPGGRYMHVAIRVGGHWLHAHNDVGVVFSEDLAQYGDRILVLRNSKVVEPDWNEFQSWLGKGFDFTYSWTNPEATYCTRLVAQLLAVEPKPIEFTSNVWDKHRHRDRAVGEPGLSPDDLFHALLGRGYRPVNECARRLESQS